ncbi:MAG: hypothetical protein SNJ84_07210 [Verrucomicrobiia bacterium]
MLPSVDIDVAERDKHLLRVREAFQSLFKQRGTSELSVALEGLLREATIDGQICSVVPFIPVKGQSIPRTSLASKAFKKHGFKTIGKVSAANITFAKAIGNTGWEAQLEIDFGTWRRTLIAHFSLLDRERRRVGKAEGLHEWYWSYGLDMPLLEAGLVQATLENLAWSAGFLATAVETEFGADSNRSVEKEP